jgi:hypothetical protein
MPSKSKKILITTESHERLVVRQTENQIFWGFCSDCGKEVEMLTLDAVTSNTGIRTRELWRLIEENLVHSLEIESGHLLICLNSLKAKSGT